MSEQEEMPEEDTSDDAPPASGGLASVVGYLVTMLDKNGNGERAELRRAHPEQPYSPTLWRLLVGREELRGVSDEDAMKWGVFLGALSHGYNLHDPGVSFGQALYDSGYSEVRLTKLLRASAEQLPTEVRSATQFVCSKQTRLNWTDVARLLFYAPDSEAGQRTRRYAARNYYSAEYRAKN